MEFGSGSGVAGGNGVLGEEVVERGDGGVDVLALKDVGRQEAENGFAGAVEDDLALQHGGKNRFGEVGGVEFDADHEAEAADLADAGVLVGELVELGFEVGAYFGDVFEEVGALDLVDDGDGDGTGERTTAEGGAVHAGGDGCRGALGREHGADGEASGEGLGDRDDVGHCVEVLKAEPLAGASEAALDLVGDEEGSGGVAELAGGGEELGRDGVDASFALDGLDEDGADVCS